MEEDVAAARDMLEGILKQRKDTTVNLEQANIQPKFGTCTYYLSFPGFYVSPTCWQQVPTLLYPRSIQFLYYIRFCLFGGTAHEKLTC